MWTRRDNLHLPLGFGGILSRAVRQNVKKEFLMDASQLIQAGKTALGIEFGSTRIKAVLTDLSGNTLAEGSHTWENSLVNGVWTYPLDEIHHGLRECYRSLREDAERKYSVQITTVGAIGISAMMHGYMAFDKDGNLLTPFQTWRNSNTQAAADALTDLFHFNIPLRWTIAHLYQRILDREKHVQKLDFVTTLDSYIHWKLTGNRVTGIGDASGIFPIDSGTLDYDAGMMEKFNGLIRDCGYPWKTKDILPKVLTAGENAGTLTADGAALLDDSGTLQAGIPMCPPEGDAGTGMVATNSVAPRTGNVSAGTSTFAMLVLEKPLANLHREIDMVTTPSGFPVAMSHANNGTSDLNAWVNLFAEFEKLMGRTVDMGELYRKLELHSLEGDPDCGGLLTYGYYSGESITKLNEGRPLFARMPDSAFSLANFMRAHLYASFAAVKLGLDILLKEEHVKADRILGHGGLFTVKGVAQRYLAAAIDTPVTVMDTASQGGPWGMAVLAAYLLYGRKNASLEDYLEWEIFAGQTGSTMEPDPAEAAGYEKFAARYKAGLPAEQAAVSSMDW